MLRSAALQDGYTQAKFDTLESFVISGLVSRERLCWRTEAWATGINDLLTIRNGRTAEDEEEGESAAPAGGQCNGSTLAHY